MMGRGGEDRKQVSGAPQRRCSLPPLTGTAQPSCYSSSPPRPPSPRILSLCIYLSRAFCVLDPLLGSEGSGKHKADLALPSWSLQSHEEARGSGKRQAGSGLLEYGTLLVRGDQRAPAEVEVTFEQRSWGGKSEPCDRRESELRAKDTASAKVLKRSGLARSKARVTDRG